MRICMVLETDFPPDIRVEKEARALLDAGHEITLVCEGRGGDGRPGSWEGVRIVRVPSAGPFGDRLSTLSREIVYRDPRFARAIRNEIERTDVLHVHDLRLAATGLAVAAPSSVPVVLDLHENLPAALDSYRRDVGLYRRLLAQPISPVGRLERYERHAVESATRVIVVVEEMAERLIAAGADPGRIAVVENTEDPARFLSIPVTPVPEFAEAARSFTLLYVGSLSGSHRGLHTAIDAMSTIRGTEPKAQLVIVGDGPERARLERQARALRADEAVRFLGHQPFERVPSLIAASDVCLVPHDSDPQTEAALPHKLFQYMLMGRPVVVSSCRPLKRVISETGAGVVFTAGDPTSLAGAVLSLRNPDQRGPLGEAGRRAASTIYSWGRSAERLVGLYRELEGGR